MKKLLLTLYNFGAFIFVMFLVYCMLWLPTIGLGTLIQKLVPDKTIYRIETLKEGNVKNVVYAPETFATLGDTQITFEDGTAYILIGHHNIPCKHIRIMRNWNGNLSSDFIREGLNK